MVSVLVGHSAGDATAMAPTKQRAERLRGAGRTSTTSRSSDLQVVPVLHPRDGGSRSAARLGASREARAQRDADEPRRFRPTAPVRPTELVGPLTSHSPEKIPIELFILRFFIPFHFPTRSFPKMLFFSQKFLYR